MKMTPKSRHIKLLLVWALTLVLGTQVAFAQFNAISIIPETGKQPDVLKSSKSEILNKALSLSPGRQVFIQEIVPTSPGKPTFLFLPGVIRGIFASETPAQLLAEKGYGVVTFNFSAQAFSVATLPKGTRGVSKTNFNIEHFTEETEKVIELLLEGKHKTIIPISLSYSGIVSPFLKGHPLMIETAPMTSTDAANPQAAKYREMLKAAEIFNPIYGPSITRSSLDSSYRTAWSSRVDDLIKNYSLPPERREEMLEGYVSMSRAAEEFTWDLNSRRLAKARRVFIVAGNESKSLLTHQVKTYLELSKKQDNNLFVLLLEAGHVIPLDQPEAYAQLLDLVIQGDLKEETGAIIITPSKGEIRKVPTENLEAFFKSLM